MLLNEVLFPRKRSPFPKRGRHSLSPSERVTHSTERGHCLPLWGRWRHSRRKRSAFPFGEGGGIADGRGLPSPLGKVAAQPTEEVRFPLWGEWHAVPREVTAVPLGRVAAQPTEEVCLPFYFYFYFNSATIATIIEIIEAIAANNPNK